ncbi:hypothetical protein ID866_5582 [Astraeus odoratus]|nr:hypothetical protein ID866_5582 [Astraeus odoratus]
MVPDDETRGESAYDVTPILHSRYFILPVSAAVVGTVIGAIRGSRMAALRFLAENAHRPPTTIRGWYLYNKTKNYRRMAAGLKHGGVDALKLGVTTLVWVGIEDGLGRCGQPWAEARELGAGVGTALAFSSVYMITAPAQRPATGPDLDPSQLQSSQSGPSSSPSAHAPRSSYLPVPKAMMKLWPSLLDQLTPRATADGREQPNPFDTAANPRAVPTSTMPALASPPASSPNDQRTPGSSSSIQHHLLGSPSVSRPAQADVTSLGPLTSPSGAFAAGILTPQISLHAPDPSMRNTKKSSQPPNTMENKSKKPSSSASSTARTSSSTSTSAPSSQASGSSATSKGQIHVKLISARGLSVTSVHARPYVVVQFEQNEFVSRDPTDEMDKEVKGTATALSRTSSSSAVATISAQRSAGRSSTDSSPTSPSAPPLQLNPPPAPQGLFGRLSAHNPVWKHQVSFDVTSEDSLVTFNVYDRVSDHHFLGTVQIKPVLVHDHTVDQWYKLLPLENEVVTGEMRVQITFEQYKVSVCLA